ncbi:MAG: CTP synthase (glutamine hydrolyzing) [archaeon]
MKYLIITGGVLSGLGKGIVSASVGKILESKGYKVTTIKIDPYLNQDAGTMNPIEHGEVFVLDDGAEVDMDFGHYERFLDVKLTGEHNITTGKIYQSVLDKERRGDYLGQTVQVIPHIINEIVDTIKCVSRKSKADISIVELGGTVGDIESMPFVEAIRQMKSQEPGNVMVCHLTLVPQMDVVGEQKTKPTQHSVRMLREAGVEPDMIICRAEEPLQEKTKKKIALFCNVKEEAVISDPDMESIYEVPLVLDAQKVGEVILRKFHLKSRRSNLKNWKQRVNRLKFPKKKVTIAMTGKYMKLHDAYVSIEASLTHAAAELGLDVDILWVDTEEFEKDKSKLSTLKGVDGIIVPGGFGKRGTEGKIMAIKYARENNIPYLGLCFGMQLAVVEYSRNAAGLKNANSTELDKKTPFPVVDILPEQKSILKMGGTMRLGAYPADLKQGSLVKRLYGRARISERHRHRYEINPDYIGQLENAGLVFSGRNPQSPVMEICECPKNDFFVASQFHPEFKSKFEKPLPLFLGFLKAASKKK